MTKRDLLTKILAVIGMALAWFPILAPILFTLALLMAEGIFRVDYLMPAELFLFVLLGGGLLLWAALRTRAFIKGIAWGLGAAIVLLFAAQGLAVVTGLASGETQPGGWQWALVLLMLAGYTLAVITLGISGVRLVSNLYRPVKN